MHNPPHLGEIIKRRCLEPLGVSVSETVQALSINWNALTTILNGRADISPEMAVRLSMGCGTSAENWLNHQMQDDLWHIEQCRKRLRVTNS